MTCYTYVLCWELGTHHLEIETYKEDFYRVIDDLSTEFTIHKRFNNSGCISGEFYYIENYYGEMQLIGFFSKYTG